MNRKVKITHKYLLNEKSGRPWQMFHYQLKEACGIPKGPKGGREWPDEGLRTVIQGVELVVLRKNRDGSSKHRAYAKCPDCDKFIPAGRLHMHVETEKCKKRAASRVPAVQIG